MTDLELKLYQKAYKAGKEDAKEEYKGRIYGIYAELCGEFKDNKAVMQKIDKIFLKAEA